METYLDRIEKKVDDPYVSIELINDMETVIAEGHKESILCFKLILFELSDRAWHWELRAKPCRQLGRMRVLLSTFLSVARAASRTRVESQKSVWMGCVTL